MVLVRRKFEEPEPRRIKLNRELASILSGNTYKEKLENANSLQIETTKRVGKFNPVKGRPIAVKFTSKSDAEMILKNKKNFLREFSWTGSTVQKQKRNIDS